MKKIFFATLIFMTHVAFSQQSKAPTMDLPEKKTYDQQSILEITSNTHSRFDKGFAIMTQHAQEFDKIMGRSWWTQRFLMDIILQETAPKVIFTNDAKLDWGQLDKILKAQYDTRLVQMALDLSKIRYYKVREDWKSYVSASDAFFIKYDKYFSDTDINNAADALFQNCDDVQLLTIAGTWMEPIIKRSDFDGYVDTYACLLYKSGKKDSGIKWEEKAFNLSHNDQNILNTLNRIKKGERIWE